MDFKKLIEHFWTNWKEWETEVKKINAQEVREMRKRHGLTQEQLAEALGKDSDFIASIEEGKASMKWVNPEAYETRAKKFAKKARRLRC